MLNAFIAERACAEIGRVGTQAQSFKKKSSAISSECTMSYGRNTKEYQRVKTSFPNLSAALAMEGVIDLVCGRLVAKGLINNDQRRKASNGMIDANTRASDLTSLLLNKVEQNKKNFQTLVQVLQQDRDTFGPVLEHMGVTDGE